jgi:TolB-like protein/DNA-binding winged helix-turn-helix (wHTH) protein/tetratricopeptide (TPR) repeat protein
LDGGFQVGSWRVDPSLNTISRNGATTHLAPKVMEVLVCLARHADETLPKEKLLQEVWPGTFVTDDALKRCILELRRVFEDDAREPRVIQTIPKRGYRLVAPVEAINGIEHRLAELPRDVSNRAVRATAKWWVGALTLGLVLLLMVLNAGGLRQRLLGGRGVPTIRSLAVLPLRNLSTDPAQEYFSEGLTDALITDLAQIGSVKVISRTSSMQYKQTKKSLPEIARELNVEGIVEGTVQHSGDRVRITVQLLHGPSDRHIWAKSYERDMRDVFALERDVTEDITRQVQAQLATPGQRPLPQPRPVDPKVLEAYLQGNYHLSRYGEGSGQEEQKKAAGYFQQAIDADPNFAPAYVGLASAHKELLRGSSEDIAIRKKSLERALELDPNDSEARAWLGFLKWQPFLDWQGAEAEFRRAIALNPNNAHAHGLLSLLLITLRRTDEGLRECRIAQQIDPNRDHMSLALYLARDYDGSIETLRTSLQRDPNNGELRCFLSSNYTQKGMHKEAVRELEQCYSLFGLSRAAANIRHAYAVAGYRGARQQWAKELENLQATKHVFLPGNIATAYAILGDKDRAFYWLEQAYQHREMVSVDGGVYFLGADPPYDPLRSDPRYKDLLRRIGLPP